MNFFTRLESPTPEYFKTIFDQNKVVLVDFQTQDLNSIEEYTIALASQLGTVIKYEENPFSGEMTSNQWTEIKYDPSGPNAYKTSNTYQPLHTDYGYFHQDFPVSFFFCVQPAKFGGATTFLDPNRVVEILKQENPKLLEELQHTMVHFGRNSTAFASRRDFVLFKEAEHWKINWNYYRALEDIDNKHLIQNFKSFLDKHFEKSGELLEIKLNIGEAVFFKDSYVLHGRNSFFGDRQLNKGAISPISLSELKNIYDSLT